MGSQNFISYIHLGIPSSILSEIVYFSAESILIQKSPLRSIVHSCIFSRNLEPSWVMMFFANSNTSARVAGRFG